MLVIKNLFSLQVIQLINSLKICDTNHYTIVYSNGTFKRCLSCGNCHEGYGRYPQCGSTVLLVACCSDGKDERIKECVSLGIKNKECSPRPDKTCAGQSPTTDATKGSGGLAMKYLIVIIVATIVVAIAVVIMIVMVYLRKKRNRRSSVQEPEAPAATQGNGSVSIGKLAPIIK